MGGVEGVIYCRMTIVVVSVHIVLLLFGCSLLSIVA